MKFADIGFLIGEKSYRGHRIAKEAISLATTFAFETLGLHKLWGGPYSRNLGSIKAFLENGYQIVVNKRNQCLCDGNYVDVLVGKVNEK